MIRAVKYAISPSSGPRRSGHGIVARCLPVRLRRMLSPNDSVTCEVINGDLSSDGETASLTSWMV